MTQTTKPRCEECGGSSFNHVSYNGQKFIRCRERGCRHIQERRAAAAAAAGTSQTAAKVVQK